MSGIKRGLMLLVALAAMMIGCVSVAAAQVSTTTVQDTVYSANGTPASGTVLVSWGSFTTAGGQSVPAGSTSATIGAAGQLTIALAPNANATPMGSYYTAVFHLSDGTTSRQYWVVPVTVPGGGPATLAEIKNEVLPISVAMQTVSKQYVDDAIAAAATGFPLDSSPYVQKAGDSMTGPLVLPGDPVSPNQAADKNYVDENVAATAGGLGQKVSLLPTASQAVSQPSGTTLTVEGPSSSTVFSGVGNTTQMSIAPSTITSNPGIAGYNLNTNTSNCFYSGFDLGNNGTSAEGWSGCKGEYSTLRSAESGIDQLYGGDHTHTAQGDTANFYTYMTSFGGDVASSDEGVTHTVAHSNQIGYFTGIVATGGTTGSDLITTSSFTCHGFCGTLTTQQFAQGGILLDTSKGGATATLASYGTAMRGDYYNLASGTVAVSTAWGNVIPTSCTNNGNGQWQNYTSTTCNVTLGTSPATPGNFVAGTDVCLAGPFQEEAAVTAVGTPSGGVQSVTFSTRYAWDGTNGNTKPSLMMQGGVCGQAIVSTSSEASWPIAYQLLGATNSTTLFFSNCVIGSCNGDGSAGNIISPQTTFSGTTTLTRGSNTVTSTSTVLDSFPVGSSIVISGCSASDLDGTFTILTNSLDTFNPVMTWAQSGTNETGTGCVISNIAPSVTFYPMAFVTGTNGGAQGDANLGTNQMAVANGDTVVGAPTSQFAEAGFNLYMGQTTGVTGAYASDGVNVVDQGPSQMTDAYTAFNTITNGAAFDMFRVSGSYNKFFNFGYRPANNGVVLFIQGTDPVSSNSKPYYLFEDTNFGNILIDPINLDFNFTKPIVSTGFTDTSVSTTTQCAHFVGQVLEGTGSDCGSGSGGGGGVTTFTAPSGSWPSWLVPTVTNASVAPNLAVTASAIPNTALANSSTTVNGQTCALGGSCTIATGSSTPPLTYTYFPAAVSDGGASFAAGFTRYSANQPQAGSVNPASSALGYLLFNATPSSPQYAELTVTMPPYWTSTGMTLNFYSTATSGNAVMDVQTACVTANQVVGSPTFSSAITKTTAVSSTADGLVTTGLISNIATPGSNGCPATGMTTPTTVTIRVYADATSAVPVYLLGATTVVGRSQ